MARILLFLFAAVPFSALASARELRIHVFGLFRPTTLVIKAPPTGAVLVEGGGHSLSLESRQAVELRKSGNLVECVTGEQVFSAPSFRASSRSGGTTELVLEVPGKLERRYTGRLDVRAGQGELVAVVATDLELAVASTVRAETTPGIPIEALKAQAVVARSYYSAVQRRHLGFDFCDTTHCQFLGEPPQQGAPTWLATKSTRGLVLRYQGSVVPALFSASCGGRTRSLKEVGISSEEYPYFPVDCPPCLHEAQQWERRIEAGAFAHLLEGAVSEKARVEFVRKMGWSAFPSNNFSARSEGKALILEGRGAGHGLGLCQRGAESMARAGSTMEEILNYYYKNTVLSSEDE